MIRRDSFLKSMRFLAIFVAVFGLMFPISADASTLSELLARQAELKRQEAANQASLNQKRNEANSLDNAIDSLDADITYTTNRIANTEDQIDTANQVIGELKRNINNSQKELGDLNNKLNSAYVSLYELSQTSTMELILQSDSLDEIVSQTQYIQAIQSDLQGDIAKQERIKAGLEKDKAEADRQKQDLADLRNSLESSQNSLSQQRGQKNYLLSLNKDQQAAYQKTITNIRQEQMIVDAQIAQAFTEFSGGASYGGTGGYPLAGESPWVYTQSKPWSCVGNGGTVQTSSGCDLNWGHGWDRPDLGYYTRNCTSYAAWKWLNVHGIKFSGGGNARNWTSVATGRGYSVNYSPKAGDLVVWPGLASNGTDRWGHVAYVQSVGSETITVSQYNGNLTGTYSVQVKSSTWDNSLGRPKYIHPK